MYMLSSIKVQGGPSKSTTNSRRGIGLQSNQETPRIVKGQLPMKSCCIHCAFLSCTGIHISTSGLVRLIFKALNSLGLEINRTSPQESSRDNFQKRKYSFCHQQQLSIVHASLARWHANFAYATILLAVLLYIHAN